MAEKRITCDRCASFDRENRRCRIGKANPRKKHESVTLAELLGPRALCIHNPWREPLLLRMMQPGSRFVWDQPRAGRVTDQIEIEFLDDND